MRTYRVFKHPSRGFRAVKVGCSYPALFFGLIWMFFKNLWVHAVLWLVFAVGLSLFGSWVNSRAMAGPVAFTNEIDVLYGFLVLMGYLALLFVPYYFGNGWVRHNLARQGFVSIGEIRAPNPAAAEAQLAG